MNVNVVGGGGGVAVLVLMLFFYYFYSLGPNREKNISKPYT